MGVILVELKHDLPMLGIDDCGGCCQTSDVMTDGHGEVYGCHEKSTVLTNREEEILKQIRELSLRAKSIKETIKNFAVNEEADEAARRRLTEELASLRQRRSQLELERIAAAEERMRLLGHA
jgi:predicted nuclease with TOPRIM domain